jgi:hypothetical protein
MPNVCVVAAYTVEPTTDKSQTCTPLILRPFLWSRLVNVVPPLVEMLRPYIVAAYTVDPVANTLRTVLEPRPLAVVR